MIPLIILLVILLVLGIYSATSKTNDKEKSASSQVKEKVAEQEVQLEDIKFLEEKGLITGIEEMNSDGS